MKEMNLGRILIENRHKRGITQDELAAHIGVSKGAVFQMGKPDLLCQIFRCCRNWRLIFDISVDELIGYQPQMGKRGYSENCISAFQRTSLYCPLMRSWPSALKL